MKRIVSLVLLLCLVFSLTACTGTTETPTTEPQQQTTNQPTTEQEPQGEVSTPLFWKVSGNGYEGEFYLLGSIHVGTDDTNNYPKQILDAFEKCTALAVESDIVEIEKDTAALHVHKGVGGAQINADVFGKHSVYSPEKACKKVADFPHTDSRFRGCPGQVNSRSSCAVR